MTKLLEERKVKFRFESGINELNHYRGRYGTSLRNAGLVTIFLALADNANVLHLSIWWIISPILLRISAVIALFILAGFQDGDKK